LGENSVSADSLVAAEAEMADFRETGDCGYLLGMFAQEFSAFFDSAMLLWMGGAVVAVSLLAASASRRQSGLIKALRSFVARNQPEGDDGDSSANS